MNAGGADRRRYVRHPIQVPLSVRPRDGTPEMVSRIGDLSEGGLSFISPRLMPEGTVVDIDVPVNARRVQLASTVVSCTETPDGYRIGLSFNDPNESFRMKLAEQVLRIAELQKEMTAERGAEVSSREAAAKWVEQYAQAFAEWYGK